SPNVGSLKSPCCGSETHRPGGRRTVADYPRTPALPVQISLTTRRVNEKRGRKAPFGLQSTGLRDYAAASASAAAFSCTGPESRPLAASSSSANSITATGPLAPLRSPTLLRRV